jgi:hypothetical protein
MKAILLIAGVPSTDSSLPGTRVRLCRPGHKLDDPGNPVITDEDYSQCQGLLDARFRGQDKDASSGKWGSARPLALRHEIGVVQEDMALQRDAEICLAVPVDVAATVHDPVRRAPTPALCEIRNAWASTMRLSPRVVENEKASPVGVSLLPVLTVMR